MPNRIRFGADFDDKASPKFNRLKQNLQTTANSTGFKSVAMGVGLGAGVGAWNAVGTAIGGAVQFMEDSVQAASNLAQSQGAVESVFKGSAAEIERFGMSADKNLGLSRRAVNEMAAVTGAQLKGMGFSLAETTDKTIELQKRAADMAATFGGPTEDALRAISALLRGERDPIERYGVSIKDADVQARNLAKGLNTTTAEGKKTADAISSLELLFEQTADTAGQFGREIDTVAGKQARLAAMAENTSAKFGEVLTPAVIEFQNVVIRAMDSASISMEDMAAAAAKGSESARLRLNALQSSTRDVQTTLSDERGSQEWVSSMDKAAGGTKDFKDEVKDTERTIVDFRKTLADEAQSIISTYYEPLDAWDEYTDAQRRMRLARRVLANKNATAEEKEDARDTVRESQKAVEEAAVALAKSGKTSKATFDKIISDLDRQIAAATGSEKQHLRELRAALLRLHGTTVSVTVITNFRARGGAFGVGGTGTGPTSKSGLAEGGYAPAGWSGWVGEEGPERAMALPGGGIYVIPHQGGGEGGASGTTIVQTVVTLDGRVIAEVVDKHLHRTLQRSSPTGLRS